jgi:hypothetical protein
VLDGVPRLAAFNGRDGDLRPSDVHAEDGHVLILVQSRQWTAA